MTNRFHSASLVPRILSALAAVSVLFLVGWKYDAFGLQILVGFIVALMLREFVRMSFIGLSAPWTMTAWFLLSSAALFASLLLTEGPIILLAVSFALFIAVSLWLARNKLENPQLLSFVSRGIVGLILCVLFPYFEIQLLRLPNGRAWFILHLAIVFGGDVMAYFVGIGFGDKKLMPSVSPKKTIAGAVGGLGGSILAGLGFATLLLPESFLWQIGLVAVVCGFVAQMGDLFLSLIKRVANVKDSGHLLPGHGGILDRIDGVILTCPLIFAYALLAETWLAR